MLESPRLS
ncbi:hypothetical protein VCCP103710_2393, partial [Vibrio cholerae CP1037(10)]